MDDQRNLSQLVAELARDTRQRETLERLLRQLRHDLNTPLGVMALEISLLKMGISDLESEVAGGDFLSAVKTASRLSEAHASLEGALDAAVQLVGRLGLPDESA